VADQFNHYKNIHRRNVLLATRALKCFFEKYSKDFGQFLAEDGNFQEKFRFDTNHNAKNFMFKLRELIKANMDIHLSEETLEGVNSPDSLVQLLATCPCRIPWKPVDGVSIDLTGCEKVMGWPKRSFIGFLMSTPSDYYRVLNKVEHL
jgi:hypothetical protein